MEYTSLIETISRFSVEDLLNMTTEEFPGPSNLYYEACIHVALDTQRSRLIMAGYKDQESLDYIDELFKGILYRAVAKEGDLTPIIFKL